MKNKRNREDNSPKIQQNGKIKEKLTIKEFPWTARQKEIIESLLSKDANITFISGPAGTAKTLLAVYAALKCLNEKKVGEIYYVRSIIESASRSLGSLPGNEFDKFKPFAMPLEDKLLELLPNSEVNKLNQDGRIKCIPINFMRGLSINVGFIICDEFQNFTKKEATTLLTRVGKFTKLILCGDSMQSDINGHSCLEELVKLFGDEESKKMGIRVFNLTKDDIMRSEICKFIVEKLEKK